MENETRRTIRDFLNGETKEAELIEAYDLKKCAICENYQLEEDLIDTEGMLNGGIGFICGSCKEDL